MKTVICCVNSKYIHSSLAPWCLFAGVKAYCKTDVEAVVIEGTINESVKAVASRIIGEKPQVLSLCAYIWNISFLYQLVDEIKTALSDCTIILGGPEVSYNAEQVLSEHSEIDYVLSGEGEKSFPQLLDCLNGNENISEVSGICFRKNDGFFISPPCILSDDPVSPYTEEYFDALNGRIAYLETSRGCPYSCAFCLSGRCGKERFFDIDRAKSDILTLAASGAKTIKTIDRTFNANKSRAKDIFRFIIKNHGTKIPDDVCFHFEIAGDILDDETIDILSSAPLGSIQLEIGLQSFNEQTLSYINRKTDTKKLKRNILKLTANQNIHIHIDLIAGLPYENLESFKSSFNTAYVLNSEMLQLGFLKLLYGAPMRDEPDRFPCDFNDFPPYEVISTPWISKGEIDELKRIEDSLDRVYNSGRFRRTLEYALPASKENPYDFYKSFSDFIKDKVTQKVHIDIYSEYLFDFLKTFKGIDNVKLRDLMVCDRIAVNSSGIVPEFLKVEDSQYKKIRNYVNSVNPMPQNQKRKRGFAVLYSKNTAVFSDYNSYNPVLREYKSIEVNIDCIKNS